MNALSPVPRAVWPAVDVRAARGLSTDAAEAVCSVAAGRAP
jgi:hypothetical protein